jgi:adenylate cyclase
MARKAGSRLKERVRFSLRWKITLPFIFLALILGLGAAFLVNQLLNQTEEFQFLRQLADSGKQSNDAIVRIEEELLRVERLIANTEGVAQAVGLENAEDLRARVLPLVINAGVDFAVILETNSVSLLTIRHQPEGSAGDYEVLKGETFYQDWEFLNPILFGEIDELGDKQVGVGRTVINERDTGIFVIGGPLRNNQNEVIGAALVGYYLDSMVTQLSQAAGANVAVYDLVSGELLGSTLEPDNPTNLLVTAPQISDTLISGSNQNVVRNIDVSGSIYTEVLTTFRARQNTVDLGLLGVSLLRTEGQDLLLENVFTVARYGAIALLLVVTIGLLISNMITRPLVEIAEASAQVAAGNLDTYVPTKSNDEIGVLARSFNRLVEGLRESIPYRDAVMPMLEPKIREEIQDLQPEKHISFDGISAEATILAADLTSFTEGAESINPESILTTLNRYYEAIIPHVSQHGGVISKFDGEMLIAFFGVLPQQAPPQISALQGVHAGLELLSSVDKWNSERAVQGQPALEMWIGLTTGNVVAGGIGNKSQLQYSVIGDTVQEARDVQEVCRELGAGALLISEITYNFLAKAHRQFKFGRYGRARLRHSGRTVSVYEVKARRTRLVNSISGQETKWKRNREEDG